MDAYCNWIIKTPLIDEEIVENTPKSPDICSVLDALSRGINSRFQIGYGFYDGSLNDDIYFKGIFINFLENIQKTEFLVDLIYRHSFDNEIISFDREIINRIMEKKIFKSSVQLIRAQLGDLLKLAKTDLEDNVMLDEMRKRLKKCRYICRKPIF